MVNATTDRMSVISLIFYFSINIVTQMLFVLYLLNSQNVSINNSEKRLMTDLLGPRLHRKRSNNWTMVRFIHNGGDKTICMGYSFKTTSTKSNRSNIFKKRTSFLNLKLQIIRLEQRHWSCMPTH